MTKNKILIVQTTLAHYRWSLFKLLISSEKYDVTIVAGIDRQLVKQIPIETQKISSQLKNVRLKIGGHVFIWQKNLITTIKNLKPDILVLPGVDPHMISSLFLSLTCKALFGCKLIWWGHNSIRHEKRFRSIFRCFFLQQSDEVFTYNNIDRHYLTQKLPFKPIKALKNCINIEDYGYRHNAILTNESSSTHSPLRILFSGRVTNEKRLDILIDALSLLRHKEVPFMCTIIGNGVGLHEISKRIEALQLTDKVSCVGEVYNDACIPYFRDADIFVLPGKVGLSIIHGLSYGLPVITSNKIEIHSPEFEIIDPSENGDFFDTYAPESLAEKLILWKKKIHSQRSLVKKKCVDSLIKGGYTPEAMSERFFEGFGLLANRRTTK